MITLPRISFGTAAIAGLYRKVTEEQAHEVLETSWNAGIRYFDSAPHYGHGLAEKRLGNFLRQKNTDDTIISTKVGRILTSTRDKLEEINGFVKPLPFLQHYDYSYDGIMRSVEDSYQRLGLSKIDILFVHDIGETTHNEKNAIYQQQLEDSGHRALSQLKSEGSIKAVGLGVNETEICVDLMGKIDMDLILLAGRYTLLDQSAEQELLPLCAKHGTRLVIGGVFNSGILATGPIANAHYDYGPAPKDILEKVTRIEEICNRHDIPLPAAALAYPQRNKAVASVLIGTAKASSLSRNLDLLHKDIPDQLWIDLEHENMISKTNDH